MEELFQIAAGYVALVMEIVAIVVITIGAVKCVISLLQPNKDKSRPFAEKKFAWQSFGVWLLLGLEFALAADIIRTAIVPTWQQIGQLAAIAFIRTFLNYFLEKDIEKYESPALSEEKEPEFSLTT